MNKDKDIQSLSNLSVPPQAFLEECFQLPEEGLPTSSVAKYFENWQIGPTTFTPNLYILPLYCYQLTKAYRARKIGLEELRSLWSILAPSLEVLLKQREEPDSGLPFLLSVQESPLSKASYWGMVDEEKILEPSFIALVAAALEGMLYLGEKINADTSNLLLASELIAFGFNDTLWDEEYGIYFPRAMSKKRLIVNNSIGGILPLLADLPSQEQAEAIYKALSINFVHGQFGYFPSECVETGKEERVIDSMANFLLLDGLSRFEFAATAKALQKQMADLHQQFGPLEAFPALKVNPKLSGEEVKADWVDSMVKAVKQDSLLHFSNLE